MATLKEKLEEILINLESLGDIKLYAINPPKRTLNGIQSHPGFGHSIPMP